MASGNPSVGEEVLRSLIGEVTSATIPGLQTALRFVVVQTRDGDSMEAALRAALEYRFALPPRAAGGHDAVAPGGGERDRPPRLLPKRRQKWRRRKAEKRAREEGTRMAELHGLNVPALLAASADGRAVAAAQDLLSVRAHASIEGVLLPLHIVRDELAYATQPVVPAPPGWRHHIAEALTSAAVAGVGSGDDEQRVRWEQLFHHSLGISDNFPARAPDWGRLVAAAFEYEMRKAEGAKLELSSQLDRADVASQVQELAKTAGLAHRSLSRLVFFAGVMALAAVAATAFYGISLLT